MPGNIPPHLQKYIVKQNFEDYSARDQAVWRFSMRQLKHYLTENAHESYLDGLTKTGIEVDEIPNVESIDTKLRKFGWGAIPVSGFIPPTAFMEFQSLGYLPIASGIRSLETILYTPAPDIIHEAAGHAPIIANPDFSQYLKNYAEVANKAILNKSDIDLYDAIRELSDLKEHPNSTKEEIKNSELRLQKTSKNMGEPSEASILGRMNWWTAEYGLIGDSQSPKIFGAGILSSIGESEKCLTGEVQKLPLTIDCINYTYDITEQQPQLFVTPSFEHLSEVLIELSEMMSYKIGGFKAVEKAIYSETVNTVELNTGLQISGIIEKQILKNNKTIFIKTNGPTQLSINNKQLTEHSKEYHSHGYSTVIDTIENKCLASLNQTEIKNLGITLNSNVSLNFDSGFLVKGKIEAIAHNEHGFPLIIQFSDCSVSYEGQTYFEPDWGLFDLAIGSEVTSVFGGPADTEKYGELYNFKAQVIPPVQHKECDTQLFNIYKQCRELRNNEVSTEKFNEITQTYLSEYQDEWLLGVELIELIESNYQDSPFKNQVLEQLEISKNINDEFKTCITKGLSLAQKIP